MRRQKRTGLPENFERRLDANERKKNADVKN
jgi:hypothetical protein